MKNLSLYLILAHLSLAALAQQKDSAYIAYQTGLTEKQAGRHKVAYDHLRKAVSINPEHTDAQRELGLEAIELRQFEISKQAFLKVLDKEPNDPQAIENLATLNFWTRRWDEAIKYGLKMQELKIETRVNYLIGKSYYEKENFGQAFRYLDAAYKEEPTNAEIPFLFARSFVEMSNYKQAVKYYLEAIALDSTKINWIYETAMAYSSIPDDKTAIKYFELAMAKGHKVDNDFIENLSNSYILAGMPDKGIDMLLKLLELRPADMELLNSIADTYYRLRKYDDAVTYWDKMLFYDKENARPLYMIGMCYQKKGDIKKGQAICDKAIEMDPALKMLRQEKRITTNNTNNEGFSSSIIYRKKFKKQGQSFSAQFRQDYTYLESDGFLLAQNNFYEGSGAIVRADSIDQEKINKNKDNSISARLSYTHPLSKKTYLEFNYGFLNSNRLSDRRTLEKADPNSNKYDEEVDALTNNFDYENTGHTGGINFRYSKPKKISFSIGGSVAKNNLLQKDLRRDTSLQLKFVNFFPRANLNLTMKKNRNLGVYYNGSTQQPTIQQLQPVADNNDPLNIYIGNPDLDVAVNHRIGLYMGAYDFLTESGFWANLNASATQKGFSTRDFVDSTGRRIYQTVNVNGMYNVNGYLDYNFKIKKTGFSGGAGLQLGYGQNVNFINGEENKVRNGSLGLRARMGYYKDKKFNAGFSSSFTQNISNSSIRTDITTNYWIQVHEFDYGIFLPWKLETGGDVSFNLRQKTSVFDDNTNAVLVSLWLERKFLKNDAAKFRLYAFDILNQNIGFSRNISTNYISEKTYNTYNQYVMLSFIWNFNKNGKPMEY